MNKISVIHSRTDQYRDQIIRLWEECLPGTPEGRFEWLTTGNPAGPTEWFLAFDDKDGNLVGTSSVMPKELFYDGQKIRGGIVGDVMVVSTYRKKGVAQQIQEVISDSLKVLDLAFLYVVPNHNSKKLFVHAGLDQVIFLRNYLIPLDIEHYLNRIVFPFSAKFIGRCLGCYLGRFFSVPGSNDYSTEIVENGFDEEIDAFGEFVKEIPNLLVGSKSVAYLTWKYCSNPNGHFRILKYRTPSGILSGYCVFTIVKEKVHIFELVSVESEYYVHLISALRSVAKAEQCVGIYFYTIGNNQVLKTLWWRGLCRIGGDMRILYSGKVFEKKCSWLFFAGDRNI